MVNLVLCALVQLYLGFGVAGLVWPDKFMPLFGVLMFPWPANHRVIRANGVIAIGAYVFVVAKFLTTAF